MESLFLNLVFYFVVYGWHYWANLLAIFATLTWLLYGVETTFYAKEPTAYMIITLVFAFVLMTWYTVIIQCFMSAIGYLYVEAEIPRSGQEKLLNNLKEGVYIMDETNLKDMFRNKTADRVNRKMMENGNTMLEDKSEVIDKQKKLFAYVDKSEIFAREGSSVGDIADELGKLACGLSLEEIIT